MCWWVLVHLGGDQRVFFVCKFLSNGKSKRCLWIGKWGKIYFKVVWSNVSQLVGFVHIYSEHLYHLDATSLVDGLWWRGQILLLKIRVSCSHNSLLLHSLLELFCFVLSSSPPPYNPSCLFATRHNTSGFSKILSIIVEEARHERFLWRSVVKVVKLCNGLWTLEPWKLLNIIDHHHWLCHCSSSPMIRHSWIIFSWWL
jgi:hypothetical protein